MIFYWNNFNSVLKKNLRENELQLRAGNKNWRQNTWQNKGLLIQIYVIQ